MVAAPLARADKIDKLRAAQKQVWDTGRFPADDEFARQELKYMLDVRPKGASLFNGHVEDNPGVAGNWGYDVEGQVRGLEVEFTLTKSTRGKFKAARASGVVRVATG